MKIITFLIAMAAIWTASVTIDRETAGGYVLLLLTVLSIVGIASQVIIGRLTLEKIRKNRIKIMNTLIKTILLIGTGYLIYRFAGSDVPGWVGIIFSVLAACITGSVLLYLLTRGGSTQKPLKRDPFWHGYEDARNAFFIDV